ncbi:MAG: hypothetical protein CMQ29_00455 [Gammaproteobacteria bacterium]|nr:hypothetical protein [Gammaproteobacteria bacterium]
MCATNSADTVGFLRLELQEQLAGRYCARRFMMKLTAMVASIASQNAAARSSSLTPIEIKVHKARYVHQIS